MTAFSRRNLHWVIFLLVISFVTLSGCRRFVAVSPTERPTTTPTPRSTHLPPAPTAEPIGTGDNPIRVYFRLIESGRAEASFTAAAEALAPELAQAAGLAVDVDLVGNDAEALAQLCASTPEQISVAWVSGAAYAAAYAQGCGSAALQISRGDRDQSHTGVEIALYGSREAGVAALASLSGKTLCRLGLDDLYTGLIPLVLLRGSGEDLFASIGGTQDLEDLDALIAGVISGDCGAAGMSVSDFEERASADARIATVVLARSVEIPYSVLILPDYLPLGQANALIDAFISIGNGSRADLLRPLLLQSEIIRAEDADFSRLRAFFSQSGLSLADLGS
ncbi:MAG: PhnD/SsuA/transferrin family substrate-binding protein [Anaerolineae bacterium]|nr:PhnD/SsuA/transferrin family substrate-binding protein [Anaerolineae bacterium]NUQ02709.1 PhnD/SsuA/transferrin family substrate-binding protein [Anaerolineae bacterium]